jgi:two-component system sensor histidine kinase SenX3
MNVRWTRFALRSTGVVPAYDSLMSEAGTVALIGGLALLVGLFVGAVAMRLLLRAAQPDVTAGGAASAGTGTTGEGTNASPGLHERVLDRAPLAVMALDADEDVLFANRRAHDLGLLDRRGVVEPLREVARSGRQTGAATREISLPTAGLPRRVLQARVSALSLPDRVMALIVEDVTEARRVDDVRRDFVANVSHEIKTPVGALRLLAEAALESIGDPDGTDSARHFVERISRESARLGRLVSELLDLSRLQGAEARPTPVPVDLVAVVTEAIDRTAPHADAKEISIVRGGPGEAIVPGVETQLVTAVANLLDNAIAYSPSGTRVAVSARAGVDEVSGSDVAEISVSDQGIGIGEADLERVFERFYRVDPARSRATGGTGLGLSIVKHIATNHGGSVSVWSVEGEGSTFTIRLPRVHSRGGSSAVDDAAVQYVRGSA